MPGRASVLHWDGAKGKGTLFSSPPETGNMGRAVTESPLALLPLGLGVSIDQYWRQHRSLPSPAFPTVRMLPRKALAWSQQDSLELAVGTGATGVTRDTRGRLH